MKTENFSHDISGLESLANELGYRETSFHMLMSQGKQVIDLQSVLNFLEDNPGAVEAIFEWAEDSSHAAALQDEDDDEEDDDDWCGDCDHENDYCMCLNEEEGVST